MVLSLLFLSVALQILFFGFRSRFLRFLVCVEKFRTKQRHPLIICNPSKLSIKTQKIINREVVGVAGRVKSWMGGISFRSFFSPSSSHASMRSTEAGRHDDGEDARSVYRGTTEDLVAQLMPSAIAKGKGFCKYQDVSTIVSKAKLVIEGERGCIECGPLLHDLRKIQPNLSFTRVLLENAIESVIKKMNWKLSKEHTDSMKRIVARRIRNCCRAVTQAEKKTPHAKWLERLPWRSGEKKSEGDVPSPKAREVNSATATIEFVYGFDEERRLAYRQKEG